MLISAALLVGFVVPFAAASFLEVLSREYPRFHFKVVTKGECLVTLTDKSLLLVSARLWTTRNTNQPTAG